MRITRAQIAIAALFCLMSTGCRVNRPAVNHAREQVLYSAIPNEPRTFNPILATDSTATVLLGDVFESLVQVNYHTLLPEPRIAERWDISEDQKTVTFHIRHGIRWFDGQPVTARDVLFTMKVIYDPKTP